MQTGKSLVAGVAIEALKEDGGHLVGKRPAPQGFLEGLVEKHHRTTVGAPIPLPQFFDRKRAPNNVEDPVRRRAYDIGLHLRHGRHVEPALVAEKLDDSLSPKRRHPIASNRIGELSVDLIIGCDNLPGWWIQDGWKLIGID